ncbi:actin-domain-containing protein [Mycena olivaceomarginata]|nr:actin-domain-containing protein [Mycena olivaceomarginata]
MSSNVPTTPQGKTSFDPKTPTVARVSSGSVPVQPSPHYVTTRRHSLYGVEDRIIIDAGSRIWKVGFSGEGRPRDVFYADGPNGSPLWDLSRGDPEQERILEVKLETCLRSVFHDSLLTDPKARKVILVEHPLLPLYIKDMMARILFENLQVPSVSFASSHLLSLLAVGRITGLIFAARPLFPHLRTTPLAGARLTSHLRALLLLFGTYLPPPTSLSAAANIPAANRSMRVPQEILTDALLEEIKARCCFVGDALGLPPSDTRDGTPADEFSETDIPPQSDSTQSESDFSLAGRESNFSSHRASSEFSIISNPRIPAADNPRGEGHLQALATLCVWCLQVAQQTGTGRGTLIIPGWIRERTTEVLFEGGDVDESSVAEVILDSLLKVSVDLRKTLASSILVVGGTSMLPGFIPRLQQELARAVGPPPTPSRHSARPDRPDRPPLPPYDPYASLRPLLPYFAILNNPSPPAATTARAVANAGKAPAFSPATMAWVGGSLAGSLKTGGAEVNREQWDMAEANRDGDTSGMDVSMDGERGHIILPDWTRSPLPAGAPSAVASQMTAASPSPRVQVGA